MEDQLVSALELFLGKHITAIIVIVAALVVSTGFVVWWITSRYDKLKSKISSIDDLPCKHHSDKLDTHDTQFSDTRALLSRMEAQLEILVGNSIDKSNNKVRKKSGLQFSAKHSPRRLNENGKTLLRKCGGDRFLEEHGGFFINKINQLQPKTALDVEDCALAVLQLNTKEDMFIPLKNWVYNEPTWTLTDEDGKEKQQEIELDDVLFVLSLPLRDRYLEKYHIPS